jgi:short subunit dehydrogenase-like uncharacterized protein
MNTAAKSFDLIVFGSTGFAGRVACHYYAKHLPKGRRWAIAGRSAEKLKQLSSELADLPSALHATFVVDHGNASEVKALVQQAKVVASYAGPFARYGESVLSACAELGIHYVDITGETIWIRKMMDRYTSQAEKSGAILIPFSGFDSVPSDIGAWQVSRVAREKFPNRTVTRVVNLFQVHGGLNGGTFETVLDMLALDAHDLALLRDPSLLVSESARARFRFSELVWPVPVPEAGLTAPPFFMETINSRVVYRSQALRQEPPFEYQELLRIPRRGSGLQAWTMALGTATLGRVGRLGPVRKLLRKYGVRSGQGPSEALQKEGFFRSQLFAYSGSELLAQLEMKCAGDPGNQATALLSCESALCLIEELDKIPAKNGGFWTPSTGLGDVLFERLQKAGIQFSTSAG